MSRWCNVTRTRQDPYHIRYSTPDKTNQFSTKLSLSARPVSL